MSRIKAFVIHLAISCAIAATVLSVFFFFWYPQPLWQGQGLGDIVWILIGVDVVLGPLITLIVFKPEKKSLKFDLAVIATVQLLALAYGVHTVFIARPAVIIFNVDRFDVVSALDVDPASLKRAEQANKFSLSWTGPETLAAIGPTDPEKRKELLFSSVQGGPDLPQLPEYYVPYDQAKPLALAKAKPLIGLKRRNAIDEAAWTQFVAALGRAEEDLVYLPLRAKVQDGAVILDKANGAVVKMVLLNPW